MANLEVKDGVGSDVYLKASGAGSNADPYIPEQAITGTVSVSNFPATQAVSGTVTIGAVTWTDFYVRYTAAGDGTPVAAPGAGSALQFAELNVISGQTIANVIAINYGTVTYRDVYTNNAMDGVVWSFPNPDRLQLPANTGLVISRSGAGTASVYGRYRIVGV
jgi:hypothetical protein